MINKIKQIKTIAKEMDTTNKFSCDLELLEIIDICDDILKNLKGGKTK